MCRRVVLVLLVLTLSTGLLDLAKLAEAAGARRASHSRASDVQKYAYELAVIQSAGYIDKHSSLVHNFARPLGALATKCYRDPVSHIASYDLEIHNILHQHGINESDLSILIHVNASIPTGMKVRACSQIFAAYATLRIHR